MRTIFLIGIIIIILVAVSWFKPAFCQELDKDKLLKEYLGGQKKIAKDGDNYTSPDIYGADQSGLKSGAEAPFAEDSPKSDSTLMPAVLPDSLIAAQPFGYNLFNAPSDLSSTPEMAVASDYVLGPGDNIIINLWGKVEKEYNLTVDRQGQIFIPKVGEIVVWGLTLAEFESQINKKLTAVYTDFKSSISLGKIRSIRVYLTGEVRKPGAYTVSSLTTLFNALYLAGGPNERGSMRNIKLIRNNKVEANLDLYQFLLKGDSKSDIRLASGDAVFIPICGPRVTIVGRIKRPAIYELLGGEKVSQLLELAGGTSAEAYLDRVMLERISPKDERVVLDLNLRPGGEKAIDDVELADGDKLTFFSLYDIKRNIVSIAGMVKHPGYFERSDSTTIRALIDRGELLPENVYYERANLFRRHPDQRMEIFPIDLREILEGRKDMTLQNLDSLYIYSIDQVKRKKYVYIEGEVNLPGQYPLYDNMTLADLIFLAGDLKRNAFQVAAELARTDSLGQVHSEYIDLTEARMKELELKEDDRAFIRRIPDWSLHQMVTIDGEVKFPGQYALYSRNETLSGLIERAGGFTDRAFPKGMIFQRHSIGQGLKKQNLPEIIANSQPIEQDSSGNIQKVDIVKFNLESMNRIIIDIDKINSADGARGDITLKSGDYIFIPDIPSGISVMGAVGANGTIKYETGENVNYYIQRAGNLTAQAEKKGIKLIKADGQVFSGGGTLRKRVDIGDAIVVPTEIRKGHDWMKTLSATASIIGGVMTSVFIISKL